MKKTLLALALISFLGFLLIPQDALAAACPANESACQKAVTTLCSCGTAGAAPGQYCWAAGNGVYNSKSACDTAMAAGGEVEGVLTGCTLTVEAARLEGCAELNTFCDFETNPKCGVCCFLQTLYKITDWIFVILIAVAALFVIIGAMNLLMSAGDPGKVTSGRNYVMYAVIGLIVGFLAKAIPAIVKLAVGA